MHDVLNSEIAIRQLRANLSPRYRKLDALERYVDGEQYRGMADFFRGTSVPMLDRAPHLVFPIVSLAIQSHASMVCGEGRFPRITSHADEDDTEADERFGLSCDDSTALDRLVSKIAKAARLRPFARQVLESAMGCGTAVVIGCVRNGKIAVDTTRAKWCNPTFDEQNPSILRRLEIRYPYLEEYTDHGQPAVRCMLYRRVIDETSDITYQSARAAINGAEPDAWIPKTVVPHNLGFCPVVWYKYRSECSTVSEIDGTAIHARLADEVTALDRDISQRDRAVLNTLDPILAEIGVDQDTQIAPSAQPPSAYFPPTFLASGQRVEDAAENMQWRMGGGGNRAAQQGRMRAPGMAYQYPMGAKAEFLTLPGDAMKAGSDNIADLEARLHEALHWVPLDPKTIKLSTALSGRAIEWLHKKQIDYDNDVRTDFGDHFLLPLIDTLLRMAYTLRKQGAPLMLSGLDTALPVLSRFEAEQEDGTGTGTTRTVWIAPHLDLVWPAYFPPSAVDAKAIGEVVRADLKAGIITKRKAIEKMADFYGILDVDQFLEGIHEEAEGAKHGEDSDTAPDVPASVVQPAGNAPTSELIPATMRPGQLRNSSDDTAATQPAHATTPLRPAKPAPPAPARLPRGRLLGGRQQASAA
jgi:hypothetical protein